MPGMATISAIGSSHGREVRAANIAISAPDATLRPSGTDVTIVAGYVLGPAIRESSHARQSSGLIT